MRFEVFDFAGESCDAGLQRGALFAEFFEFMPHGAKLRVLLCDGGAQGCCFGAEALGLGGELFALFGEGGLLFLELYVLFFAARALSGCTGVLAFEVVDALLRGVAHALVLLEVCGGVAAALFKAGECGCCSGCCGLYFLALAAKVFDAQDGVIYA